MKIAIDVSQLVYSGTGVGRYVYHLAQALLRLNSDYQFVFLAGVLRQYPMLSALSRTDPWDKASWKFYPLPPKFAATYFNRWNLPIDRLVGPVDLLHTSDWTEPVSKALKVTTVHDLVFRKYPETVDPLIFHTQAIRLDRVIKFGTHIIADSASTKKDLIEQYYLPSEKIDVIYPGIDQIFKPANKTAIERVKKKYKLPEQYVLSLGVEEPRKNLAKLSLALSNYDLPLVLTGRHGWGEQLAPSAKIHTTGFIADLDLPAVYSGATVFAYPSLYEGFGFPVLEAMACGTPVVTSNVSSLPEVAGKAAVLVDPSKPEAIRQGIEQARHQANALARLGVKQAAKFSWEKAAKSTLQIYEKIIKL